MPNPLSNSVMANKDKYWDPTATKAHFDFNHKINKKELEDRTALNKLLDSNISEQFNALIKVTVAQVKNQNPDPNSQVNISEIINNFVSIIQTAQQAKNNELTEQSHSLMQESIGMNAAGLLNADIQRKSNIFEFKGEPITIYYNIPSGTATSQMEILDTSGQKVATLPTQSQVGAHAVEWDGKNDIGAKLPEDRYFVRMIVKDKDGKTLRDKDGNPITAVTEFSGKISAYDKDDDGKVIFFDGSVPVDFNDNISRVSKATKAYQKTQAFEKNIHDTSIRNAVIAQDGDHVIGEGVN